MKEIKEISPERKRELQEASMRMRMLLDEFHLNYAKIGRLTGRGRGDVFRNIVEERNVISVEIADDICRVFPQINYKWIYAGMEPMIIPVEEIPVKIKPNEKIESPQSEIIELLKDKVKLLEEKINTLEEKLKREKRFGGSGTIPETTPEAVKTKTAG